LSIREIIKNTLMVKKIFPINNEKVSKGKLLADKIGIPYIEYLKKNGENPYKILFTQTDNDLLQSAISVGIIMEKEKKCFYPEL
jgi:hypothetical protein